ncbi:AGAP013463-PA-like protein [Anopheles sinensis]|uniref:AGAP013463-PA-like protein n=1 Tax=Anopheles sinensis TaxID=74873 RepID=A0A084W5E1_ANOSI|nr:AGAP013463-PA-like protein [Anopheles sinensis]
MSFGNLFSKNKLAVTHFLNDDVEQFEKVLMDGANVNSPIRGYNYTIFEMACLRPGKSKFIELCLKDKNSAELGIKKNSKTGEYPIHLAALSMDKNNLTALLTANNIKIEQKCNHRTALFMLFERLPESNWKPVFDCIEVLLKKNADINTTNKDNVTPIELLLSRRKDTDAKRMIEKCLELTTVEILPSVGSQIKAVFPDMKLPMKETTNRCAQMLVKAIYSMRNVSQEMCEELTEDDVKIFLVDAVRQGEFERAKVLAESNAMDGTKLKPSMPVCQMLTDCCNRGETKMLKWLLPLVPDQTETTDFLNNPPLLIFIVKRIASERDRSKYLECMKVLLRDPRIEIDRKDEYSLTALHNAVKYELEDVQKLLLANGAYLGGQDRHGCPLVSEINPTLLEQHLDTCVTDNGRNSTDGDYTMKLTFANFLCPEHKCQCAARKHQKGKGHNCPYDDEMLPIVRIAHSPATTRLLRHPVIASILLIKWLRISLFFYLNLIVCSMFFFSFMCFLVFYYRTSCQTADMFIFLVPTILGLAYLAVREITQFVLNPREYIKSTENYIELMLIVSVMTALILHFTSGDDQIRNTAEVCAILLSAVEFTVLLATIPRLSFCTHMVMLKTVAKNFIQCLSLYSMILVAFAICFYTLFRVPSGNSGSITNKESSQTEAANTFNEFGKLSLALLKTAVMMTGELDAASFKFEQSWGFYLVFTLFLFFVPIVLFNLMNGLAVHDAVNPHELMENLEYIYIRPNQGNEIIEPNFNEPQTESIATGSDDVELGLVGHINDSSSLTTDGIGDSVINTFVNLISYVKGPNRMDDAIVGAMQEIVCRRVEACGRTASSEQQTQQILQKLSEEMGAMKHQLAVAADRMKRQLSEEIKNEIKVCLHDAK